jgi:hypothetical protein
LPVLPVWVVLLGVPSRRRSFMIRTLQLVVPWPLLRGCRAGQAESQGNRTELRLQFC